MFEAAELGHKIDKKTFNAEAPKVREGLLEAQYALMDKPDFPVIILVSGVDGAGKSDAVNLLNAWMDPRHIQTHGFGPMSEEEAMHPPMWRYWRRLPPKGKAGIFFGSWYNAPINGRVLGGLNDHDLEAAIARIVRFERMLVEEGALLLKFWFHLSKTAQKKRLMALEANPRTRWRVTKDDWNRFGHYDEYRSVSERTLRETSTGEAPWLVIEGTDENYRSLTVTKHLLATIQDRLAQPDRPHRRLHGAPFPDPIDNLRILDALDLGKKIASKKDYDKELEKWQGRLAKAFRSRKLRDHSVVAVFEGMDAAGKGGAIRRITAGLDARKYDIIPIAAPTEEERAQPYLWRFWRHLPRNGKLAVFDRSWYGRVLVERVEGFCSQPAWRRAYQEINDFEEQLVESGVIIAKFWLTISQDEQLRRFKEREQIAFKRFKITEEDWRNRDKWDDYVRAASDMIERTGTELAPWTMVEAEDKNYARIKVLRTLVETIEQAL
ncbi:polyphosphate:AMP phosphotransferase [Parasulfuritortus cantonensis]|uniref:Polyphosphate:AMP phosphotransferase n=1 Tax=Parasulfuritortus cantonensis TaxID=2528202 RepID=A0A4R1BL27_9PROT|nr:polyphosphate:AMP phosphotransferase [Parasulfuritortus cantonensis]TCJ18007.1 polyphosphate:AMP phosphotransferase [Parasulfuritortus cantonensis]